MSVKVAVLFRSILNNLFIYNTRYRFLYVHGKPVKYTFYWRIKVDELVVGSVSLLEDVKIDLNIFGTLLFVPYTYKVLQIRCISIAISETMINRALVKWRQSCAKNNTVATFKKII